MNFSHIFVGSFSYFAIGFCTSLAVNSSALLLGASNVIISPLCGIFFIVLGSLFKINLSFCCNVGNIDVCFTIVGVPTKYFIRIAITIAIIKQYIHSKIFFSLSLIFFLYFLTGIFIVTSVPSLTLLLIVILPPFFSIISFAIERPKPVPPSFLERALSTL